MWIGPMNGRCAAVCFSMNEDSVSSTFPTDTPMPIYGYSKRLLNEHGLREMSEVTFEVSMADLRRIATFLNDFADRVESGTWRSSHRHLTQFDRHWARDHPHSDVIVLHPAPDPPKRMV
jgi:hypothetical protein